MQEAIEKFVEVLQEKMRKHYAARNMPNQMPIIVVDGNGKKYQRIARADQSGRVESVYCFINLENGDIHKAASFKAPEVKHPRGNINSTLFGMEACGPYGTVYLRGGGNIGWQE